MKFFISLLTIFLLFWTNVNAKEKTVDELVNIIANTNNLEMKYFFWLQSGDAYLAKIQKDGISLGVWYYTKERKWQPIHNSSAFDGFPGASKSFASVTRDKIKETITFSSLIDGVITGDTLEKAKALENKTVNISWYFWLQSKDAFLFKKAKNSSDIRIWYYTGQRKWRPIYNASAFDGYKEAKKTLENASFDPVQGTLSTGKSIPMSDGGSNVDNPKDNDTNNKEPSPSSPDALSLTSSSMKEGEMLSMQYAFSSSPELSWKLNDDVKSQNIVKSYAISLQDMNTKQYHWLVTNIPSTIYNFPESAPVNYKGSKYITHDFGLPYKGPFPPAGETHEYKFTIYAFSSDTIAGKDSFKIKLYSSSITVKYTGK